MSAEKLIPTTRGAAADCLRELADLIFTGQLIEAFRDNPQRIAGCVVNAIGTLLLAIGGHLHKSHTDPTFGAIVSPGESEIEDCQRACVELDSALEASDGNGHPVYAGPLSNLFFGLVLKKLLAYLSEHLPDLIDQIGEIATEQIAKPTIAVTPTED